MNTPAHHSNQYYREKEKTVFSTIPGMDELLTADRSSFYELEKKFPDAAFVLRTVSNLLTGDHEQNTIHQKAYSAILNGGSIPDARFRFNKDMDAYVERHMWDSTFLLKAKKAEVVPPGFHLGLMSSYAYFTLTFENPLC